MNSNLNFLKFLIVMITFVLISDTKASCGNPAPSMSVTPLGNKTFSFYASYSGWGRLTWLMGNGDKLNWNGTYTYNKEGKYDIKLVRFDSSKSCTDTFSWGSLCLINTGYTVSKTGPFQYKFTTVNADTNKRRYTWDLGNSTSGSGSAVLCKYGKKGYFTTKLQVYDSTMNCSQEEYKNIVSVKCQGVDSFGFKVSCSTDKTGSISYTNNTTYGKSLRATIYWGDGTNDTVMNRNAAFLKTHTWGSSGAKNSFLVVSDSSACTDTIYKTIYLKDTAFDKRFFGFDVQAKGNTVTMTMKDSLSNIYFKHYEFGNWTLGSYPNMSYSYPYMDTSTVRNVCALFMISENGVCSTKVCKTVVLKWFKCNNSAPAVSMSHQDGRTYNFYIPNSYGRWLYGNGSEGIGHNFNYTYPADGNYNVKIITTDSQQWCRDTFSLGSLCVMNTAFTSSKSGMYQYKFKALNTDTVHRAFIWDPGNGKSGAGPTFKASYAKTGQYLCKLTIYDSTWNCASDESMYVNVIRCSGADTLRVKGSCDTDKTGELTFFNPTPYGLVLSAEIFWGDGTSDTVQNRKYYFTKQHTYSSAGVKSILLNVIDSSGCIDSLDDKLTVPDTAFQNKFLGFSASLNHLKLDVSVNDSFTKKHFINWEFGDATYDHNSTTSHIYSNKTASYNLCAQYQSWEYGNYCRNSVCKTIAVTKYTCGADFTKYQDTTKSFSMFVVNRSYGTRYHWDFGDGDTSNSYTPSHTYAALGLYNLCVTAYAAGCVHTYCDTIGFDSAGNMSRSNFHLQVVDGSGQVGVKTPSALKDVFVYPNPAESLVTVINRLHEAIQIELFDIHGRWILKQHIGAKGKVQLDMSALPEGIYILKGPSASQRILRIN